jgi:predicted RNase H-like nuclease (RuvC/YqgF family)
MFISKKEWEKTQSRLDFCQGRLRDLLNRTDDQQEEINRLERKVTRLACEHKDNIEHHRNYYGISCKLCKDCGKILETYTTEKEFLKGMFDFYREKVAEFEEKLKEYE